MELKVKKEFNRIIIKFYVISEPSGIESHDKFLLKFGLIFVISEPSGIERKKEKNNK
ncbi:MAG: hypothetical protein ACP5O4_05730 [bacterium]